MAYISNSTSQYKPYGVTYNPLSVKPVSDAWKNFSAAQPSVGMSTGGFANKILGLQDLSKYQGGTTGTKTTTPINTQPVPNGTTGVVNPTTSTSTLPYGQNSGDNTKTTPKKGLLPTPTPITTTKQPEPTTGFGGFVTGLQGASRPNKTQTGLVQYVMDASREGKRIGEEAARISAMYGNEIARVGQLGAGAVAGAKTTGTDVVGRGNAAIASESASNRIASLSAAQAAALQGTQQQLTGAEQGITGLTNALTGANVQQQLGISALGTGANITAPSPAQYGQTVFNPYTGQYTGGNLDPQTQAQTLAQRVMSGQMTYDQALASLSYAGNAGTNFLNNAIATSGGNPLQLQAQGAGQQANISTQTTAGTDIARQGLAQATQDYVQLNSAAQFANQQSSAVSDILAQTGLNSVSSTDYNKALNTIKGKFSDVNFQALNTALREAQIAYTNVLSSAGLTPTGSETQALATLSLDSSAEAINASIQQLENAVARRLQAQYGAVQQYNQNLGSGNTLGGSSGGGGGGGFAETW